MPERDFFDIIIGALLAGPVWVAAVLWFSRRMWRNVRRLSARARGQGHLIEVAQLAGGLAHEIRNPLSTINVNLKLLSEDLARRQDEESKRMVRRLETVRSEADRLRDILDDFLRYAGHYELQTAPVDVRRMIEELVDFFAPQAEAGRIVHRSTMPETEVRCSLDVNLIKQALLNLMINGSQAMPDGGELLVKLSTQRNWAVIEVIDTGSGMEPDELNKIFGVYYSTKKQGSGLGLPTTRRIIREHGGDITVESEPGKGTRFVITLPLEIQ